MTPIRWMPFPCEAVACRGLAWIEENLPDLWRLPRGSVRDLPEGVRRQQRFSSGARLRLRCDTSELHVKVAQPAACAATGLDVYLDGRFRGTASVPARAEADVVCFTGASREMRDVTVYLPVRAEVRIVACGIDGDAVCERPSAFAVDRPMVVYGSSVAQGIGAARPGTSYAAVLGRSMEVDVVNLGFGGAGKAEAAVVDLVARADACCYLLDLGKSYGRQPVEPYGAMLATLRDAHPDVPIVCITPIVSTREVWSEEYADLSHHTRSVMREAVAKQKTGGDTGLFLMEGETLLSRQDLDGLSGDGVHPNDLGHRLIADRLRPIIETALRGADAMGSNGHDRS